MLKHFPDIHMVPEVKLQHHMKKKKKKVKTLSWSVLLKLDFLSLIPESCGQLKDIPIEPSETQTAKGMSSICLGESFYRQVREPLA